MTLVAVALILMVLVGVAMLSSRSGLVPWMNEMTRLNPGVQNRAEWMAPRHVILSVEKDYLAFYRYAAEQLPKGWLAYTRDLNEYLCGEMLRGQRESLSQRLRHDRGRFVEVLRANHNVQVRHFSGDGLRCVVIDQQSEQRLATYDYWTGRRVHTQDIGNTIYIYEMHYDQSLGRWKLARFVQQLPLGVCQPGALEIHLPTTMGRDQ